MESVRFKSCNLSLKELDVKKRLVEGYFSAFNVVDSDGEMVVPGAFTKSIIENGINGTNRIKHLFNHQSTTGVLQLLEEDSYGLHFISKVGSHTLGNDVLAMYADGIITEHSVGYNEIADKVEIQRIDGKDIRVLKEVRLWEGSSLDKWGANMYARTIKSIEQAEMIKKDIEDRIGLMLKALTGRTSYSDETYENLNYQLLILKEQLKWILEGLKPSAFADTKPIEPPITPKEEKRSGVNFVELTKLFKA